MPRGLPASAQSGVGDQTLLIYATSFWGLPTRLSDTHIHVRPTIRNHWLISFCCCSTNPRAHTHSPASQEPTSFLASLLLGGAIVTTEWEPGGQHCRGTGTRGPEQSPWEVGVFSSHTWAQWRVYKAPSTRLQLCFLCPALLPVVGLWLSGKAGREDANLFLLGGIWSMRRLAISSQVAGPDSRPLTSFPH